jgi:hypothetical protein
LPAEFREQIRRHTAAAIAVLVDALKDPDARVRVAAAKEILDRGHCKPATVADVTLRQEPVDLAQSHLQALIELAAKRLRTSRPSTMPSPCGTPPQSPDGFLASWKSLLQAA